jgi:lipid-binding SYLF domain-containing protein
MTRPFASLVSLLFAAALVAPGTAIADSKTTHRLEQSQKVFEAFSDLTEQTIPSWLLERAYGIVVVPQVVKAALMFGGRGGKGVMAVRNPDGSWSNPTFVTLGGINFGLQFGVQATDVVLVLMSRQSVEGIAGGKVTLGADASVAAGPLGRSSAAATDATLSAQVLSYSRSSGLFAGVALDGSVIAIDRGANEAAYGVAGVLASQILEGQVGDHGFRPKRNTGCVAGADACSDTVDDDRAGKDLPDGRSGPGRTAARRLRVVSPQLISPQ